MTTPCKLRPPSSRNFVGTRASPAPINVVNIEHTEERCGTHPQDSWSRRCSRTGPLTVAPGDTVMFTIAPDVRASFVAVR